MKMKTALTLNPIPKPLWDEVLDSAAHGTIFHSFDYLKFITRLNAAEFLPLGIFRGRDVLGVLPVVCLKRGPFRIAGSPIGFAGMVIPYLGPVIDEALLPELLGCFERWLTLAKIDYAELRWNRTVAGPIGWETSTPYTVVLQVPADEQALWKGFSKGCRSSIKKAQNAEVTISDATDTGFFNEYLNMAVDVYRKSQRKPSMGIEYFDGLWTMWREAGVLRMVKATHQEQTVAAAAFLLDAQHRTAYYLDGVSYSRFNSLCANNLVQFHFLKQLVAEGYEAYDMLGANIPGIRQFKLSFGGQLVPYTYAFQARNAIARIARDSYKGIAATLRYVRFQISNQAAGSTR
jgi:hypothetical protein